VVQLEGKLSGFAAGMFRSCLFSEKNGEEKTGGLSHQIQPMFPAQSGAE